MATSHGSGQERWCDEEDLRSLSTAYAAAADDRDGERFAALFVDRGELVVAVGPGDGPASSHVGHEALRRVPEGLRRYERTFHQVSNHRFSIDRDRAMGEVLCVAHHVMTIGAGGTGEPAGLDTVWFIRYLDRYVRTDGGWRFERRSLYLQWVEEHPVPVLPTGAVTERLGPSPGPGSSPGSGSDAR